MGRLTRTHELQWHMALPDDGHTVFTLRDQIGRRWGWVINAGDVGWTAHLGDFGQCINDGLPALPFGGYLQSGLVLAAAKEWVEVEVEVADSWAEHSGRTGAQAR